MQEIYFLMLDLDFYYNNAGTLLNAWINQKLDVNKAIAPAWCAAASSMGTM